VLTSSLFKDLRRRDAPGTAGSSKSTLAFASDIAPILAASCGGSACHGQDNTRSAASSYVGNEAVFRLAPVVRISGGAMPPPNSGKTLSPADRAKLVRFLSP